jgi:chromosome segregation ATPase
MPESGKGRVVDGLLTNLNLKVDAAKRQLSNDQNILKDIEIEIGKLQPQIEKTEVSIDQNKKLREEVKAQLRILEAQFDQVICDNEIYLFMHTSYEVKQRYCWWR